jgi:plasmid stability protein
MANLSIRKLDEDVFSRLRILASAHGVSMEEEVGYGLRALADGQRRKVLQNRFEQFIAQGFENCGIDIINPFE